MYRLQPGSISTERSYLLRDLPIVEEKDGIRRVYSYNRKILLFEKSLEEIEREKKADAELAEEIAWQLSFDDENNDNIEIMDLGVATGEKAPKKSNKNQSDQERPVEIDELVVQDEKEIAETVEL